MLRACPPSRSSRQTTSCPASICSLSRPALKARAPHPAGIGPRARDARHLSQAARGVAARRDALGQRQVRPAGAPTHGHGHRFGLSAYAAMRASVPARASNCGPNACPPVVAFGALSARRWLCSRGGAAAAAGERLAGELAGRAAGERACAPASAAQVRGGSGAHWCAPAVGRRARCSRVSAAPRNESAWACLVSSSPWCGQWVTWRTHHRALFACGGTHPSGGPCFDAQQRESGKSVAAQVVALCCACACGRPPIAGPARCIESGLHQAAKTSTLSQAAGLTRTLTLAVMRLLLAPRACFRRLTRPRCAPRRSVGRRLRLHSHSSSRRAGRRGAVARSGAVLRVPRCACQSAFLRRAALTLRHYGAR